MSVPLNEVQQKRSSLRRTPPPKAPPKKGSPPRDRPLKTQDSNPEIAQLIPGFKLKKTGFRDSLIAEDVDNKHLTPAGSDEPENELLKKIKQRRVIVEQGNQNEAEETAKPKLKPKPKPKPHPDGRESERKLSSSSDDSSKENKGNSTDVNRNLVICKDSRGEPILRILPTLESLGKPPSKPVKVESLEDVLAKYSRADIVIAHRRNTLSLPRNIEGSIGDVITEADEFQQEDYDDVDEETKAQILDKAKAEQTAEGDSGILEENYDDVDEIKEKVNEINRSMDEAQNAEPICEESYDDLDTVAEEAQNHLRNDFSAVGSGETFGEEMYEALPGEEQGGSENGFDSLVENKVSPTATPREQIKEKGKKDLKKEMELQKKKEREELKRKKEEEKRREKEEKEEKKRREEEKKKRERDDRELRKKHKLKPGSEESHGVGELKSNFPGEGKFELSAKQGDTLVVVCEKGCPSGKWLVKNTEGHLGYVPTELIQLKIDSEGNRLSAIITEDFYEDVDKYQSKDQIEEEGYEQEVYDDIGGQEPIDEDFYEELPNN